MPKTKQCENCCYWSDQIARVRDDGVLEAACLKAASNGFVTYTTANESCELWTVGTPIDDPDQPMPLCPRGHPMDGMLINGRRYCHTCNRARKPQKTVAPHTNGCTGFLEPHVRHDPEAGLYAPMLRCKCGATVRTSRSRFESYRDAERSAKMLSADQVSRSPSRQSAHDPASIAQPSGSGRPA
jgi:hypothetical protein